MSTFARLTLIGLYNNDDTLFDKLTLPAAYDRQTFIDTVLLDQGEKCVAYPEPEFFKYAVGVWSRKWADSLTRIAYALTEEYNPIHNYDRYEDWTDDENGSYNNEIDRAGTDRTTKVGSITTNTTGTVTTENTGEDTTALSGSDITEKDDTTTKKSTGTVTTAETGTSTETTNNMTTERTVSAFNESGYQPDEKTTVNGSITRTPNTLQTVTPNTTETTTGDSTETITHGKTETLTRNTKEEVKPDTTETVTPDTTDETTTDVYETGSGDDARNKVHRGHMWGNIGVTSNMQLVQAEIELREKNNMYAIAATLFADDLLLMLY